MVGTTWPALTSPPAQAVKVTCDSAGKFYLCANGDNNIYVYDGTWHTYVTRTSSEGIRTFAIDPAKSTDMACTDITGHVSTTVTGPATGWTDYSPTPAHTGTNIPWLTNIPDVFMTCAAAAYGPSKCALYGGRYCCLENEQSSRWARNVTNLDDTSSGD